MLLAVLINIVFIEGKDVFNKALDRLKGSFTYHLNPACFNS